MMGKARFFVSAAAGVLLLVAEGFGGTLGELTANVAAPVSQMTADRLEDGYCISFVLRPTSVSKICCMMYLPDKEKWDGRLWGFGNGYWGGKVNLCRQGNSATVMTDMGTSAFAPEGNCVPREIMDDFGWRATHLMTVEAKRIVKKFYGRSPHHSYFKGASTGGGQGFCEAQRYPGDYDGIYAGVPAFDRLSLATPEVQRERLKRRYGAWFTPEEENAIYQAELDYFADKGPSVACRRFVFDPVPSKEALDGCWREAVRRNCGLVDREALWKALFDPVFANGRRLAPGMQIGCEFKGASDFLLRKIPQVGDKGYDAITDDDLCVFADEPSVNFKDAAAMRRYFDGGGRMIVDAGLEDTSVPERAITEFVDLLGPHDNYVYFRIPGRTHPGSPDKPHRGRLSKAGWIADVEKLLQDWVEKGVRPTRVRVPLFGCRENELHLTDYFSGRAGSSVRQL